MSTPYSARVGEMTETIKKLTHIEHILKRPDSYVGPVEQSREQYWVLDGDVFVKKYVQYSPALLKIFDEILVNAIDRNSLFPKLVTNIAVNVDKNTGAVTISNNGPLGGIVVKEHPTERCWNPELTFGHLLTSTNYDDTQKRIVGGRNGYGAKLTNIYSSMFEIVVKDGDNKAVYTQRWLNNMTRCDPPTLKKFQGATSSVSITFIPDWKRFGMTGMTDDVYEIFQKRVWDSNICTSSNCKIKFQGEPVPKMSFEKYAKMYTQTDVIASMSSDRWSVCVAPSQDGFEQVSFVNGICTTKGGTHVDHAANQLATAIKMHLKPQQIKNTFFIFVKATLENPSFSSQVKSECTSKVSDFGSRFEVTPAFVKAALRSGIQQELATLAKYKEMQQLKKTDAGAKKSKITGIPKLDDANKAGTAHSHKCTLIVTEGDSAKTLAVAGLSVVGREYYGVFPLRGKCKNVRDASVKTLTENKEFSDLKKILGLQQGKTYEDTRDLRYGRLLIMTDADHDGSHIKGLILNMFHFFWPSLLKIHFVESMVTPIIKATNGKEVLSFYTDHAFKAWHAKNVYGNWKIKYYKGLGTSTSQEAREYFKNIEKLVVQFDVDTMTDESMILAFDKKKADDRKTWLLDTSLKDTTQLEIPYGHISRLGITDFVHKDLVNFSMADLKRSIAHVADGLKPSQRKVLYACFHKNLHDEMKVAQLAAYVAEKSAYHHGEVSLADTIVKLANDYVGSNNMNMLIPCGQFGTRLMGGKDASQTRYIFTKLAPEARKVFDHLDDPILKYMEDDGRVIEPEFYVPVIPMVLVNGTEGIGTGFSSYVPSFNPMDIVKNLDRALRGMPLIEMTPYFRGFKGTVTKDRDGGTWVADGVWHDGAGGGRLTITELPPGRWTQDFKEYLDDMVDKKLIQSFTNKSTIEDVYFEIHGYEGTDVVKDFKLRRMIHMTNMHLFHPDKGIVKYTSPEEILVDFVKIRLEYYRKRKEHLIHACEQKSRMCTHKALFVKMVVEEELRVFKRKRSELENEMIRHFPLIDGKFDYLLNIRTYQYTEESVKELMRDAARAEEELRTLKTVSHTDLWRNDIKKLYT